MTPAAMTLAMVMTAAELEELERRMLELYQQPLSHVLIALAMGGSETVRDDLEEIIRP